jgi:hypothetical protein
VDIRVTEYQVVGYREIRISGSVNSGTAYGAYRCGADVGNIEYRTLNLE